MAVISRKLPYILDMPDENHYSMMAMLAAETLRLTREF